MVTDKGPSKKRTVGKNESIKNVKNLDASLLQATLESTADGILVVNGKGKIVTCNQRFRKMWRIPLSYMKSSNDEKAINHVLKQLLNPEVFIEKLAQLYAHPEMDCFDEIEFIDGRIFERYSIPQYINNEIVGRVFSFRDVTRRKQMEEQLFLQATCDPLTGLPNRILLRDRINQEIKHAKRQHTKVAVLFFDLDRFKLINDSLGHNIGDLLLQEVSQRLKKCIREEDTLARWGGDEFIIVLRNIDFREQIIALITECQEALAESFYIDHHSITMTSSVGVSFYPMDGKSTTVLLKNADAAMYTAKADGRNNYRFYTPHMNDQAVEHLAFANDLRKALDDKEFFLLYQPLIDIKTQKIISVEALIRWTHPVRGLVSPLDFIHVAEETGIIQFIGEWVLRTACEQNKRWQKKGLEPVKVAVNVSGIQFKQNNIVQVVGSALLDSGLEAKYLDVELTESSLMGNNHIYIATMNELKKMGVGLVIDDFGTGYSNLGYLKRFPVNKIKIDKSFVRDISRDEDDKAIVQAIIAMAQQLKLRVVAEGVETKEQLDFLQSHNCDEVQGYYFSPPMKSEEFEEVLLRQKNKNFIEPLNEAEFNILHIEKE